MFVYFCYVGMEFENLKWPLLNNRLFIALLLIFWPPKFHGLLFLDWILILGKNLVNIYFWRFLSLWRGRATLISSSISIFPLAKILKLSISLKCSQILKYSLIAVVWLILYFLSFPVIMWNTQMFGQSYQKVPCSFSDLGDIAIHGNL